MTKTILLTGGAGFIGHHVAEHFLKNTDYNLIFLDRLDCSGSLQRIVQIANWNTYKTRCKWVFHDLKAEINSIVGNAIGRVNYIIHMAASTRVDRSITNPLEFVYDNVLGTAHLLEYARRCDGLEKMIYFSTDEVFGPAPTGTAYKEWDRYKSGNPYSATKAGGEELALAYHNTYALPIMITHTMNVFGERQHWEKFIPMCISKILKEDEITIHADKTCTIPGSRFYIHARNIAGAILFLLEEGEPGEKYNLVGEKEVNNLDLAQFIAKVLYRPLNAKLVDFHSSRPGHDLRYALDGSKMKELGWRLPTSFETSLEKTVDWTVNHYEWLGQ